MSSTSGHAHRRVGLLALTVALAVLVSGLFVPGWMVGGEQRSKPLRPLPAAPTDTPQSGPAGAWPRPVDRADRSSLAEFASRYVAAFNARDVAAIGALSCRAPTDAQQLALLRSLRLQRKTATLAPPPVSYGELATVPVTLRDQRQQAAAEQVRAEPDSVTVARSGRGWCVPNPG